MIQNSSHKFLYQISKELHEKIDRQILDAINRLENQETDSCCELEIPLYKLSAYFIGKTPLSVVYPNGKEIYTPTWERVVKELLLTCADDGYGRLVAEKVGEAYDKSDYLKSQKWSFYRDEINFCSKLICDENPTEDKMIKAVIERVFIPLDYDYKRICLKVYDPLIQEQYQKSLKDSKREAFNEIYRKKNQDA